MNNPMNNDIDDDLDVRRLRWHCRRGMRELDQLFLRYLNDRWPVADDIERNSFLRLLSCEDDKLWLWCMGRERPDDSELHNIVQTIIKLPH